MFLLSTLMAQGLKEIPNRGPALEAPLVKEFVGAAHSDLDKTTAMLTVHPALLNATWDWGRGNFETGLGGASQMSRKDIAELLITKSAPMDIFTAAMLGKLEIVKVMVAAYPGIENSLGPHKIPLLAHAKRGNAEEVVRYFSDKARI